MQITTEDDLIFELGEDDAGASNMMLDDEGKKDRTTMKLVDRQVDGLIHLRSIKPYGSIGLSDICIDPCIKPFRSGVDVP